MGDKNYQLGLRSSSRRMPAAWNNRDDFRIRRHKKFENMLYEKVQELEIELDDSNTDREKEILLNEIDTLKCVLGHLFNLKPCGNKTQAIEIAKANNHYKQAIHLRKQLIKIQDVEYEISAQIR
ncbi:MAG: hypothetical protein ACRD5B_00455 [Nitrososphaeraceae archaeon]